MTPIQAASQTPAGRSWPKAAARPVSADSRPLPEAAAPADTIWVLSSHAPPLWAGPGRVSPPAAAGPW